MNDPWDVKSVRRSGQYLSCMRLNGVPLLPPILSKDCHKEMQYYKLLAKEVEKRISIMQKMNETAGSDSEDHTDAPELPECEQSYDSLQDEQDYKKLITELDTCKPIAVKNGNQSSKMNVDDTVADMTNPPKLLKDMKSTLNETNASVLQTLHQNHSSPTQDIPERDCTEQDILDKDVDSSAEVDTGSSNYKKNLGDNSISLISKDTSMSDLFTDLPSIQDGPSSLNSKSFTGSLNNLHSESLKDSQKSSGILVRQLSYTLLQPSPQLLAHLEFQAQNNGIEMNSISMSESFTNVSNPKKRRNWDLQTAKEKWSDMAQELKNQKRNIYGNTVKQNLTVKAARQVITPPNKRNNGTPKPTPKSEPIMKKKPINPVKNNVTTRTADSEPITPNANTSDEQSKLLDQGVRVRELYEKIQKQQLVQMETLVEKQKKEQILLQQVFEEQNKMLLKQLKTICPKSPIEVKEAWGDKHCEGDRGPVSLSQLMNCKTSALSDTNSYLNRCDNVLKKSRDITGSLKKRDPAPHSQVNAKNKSSTSQSEGSRTRTHSPIRASTSRRLNYDTSVSSDRENDPILTDRTNDTMADLNVTFPSDYSDEANSTIHNSVISPYGKETRYNQSSSINSKTGQSRVLEKTVSTERSLKSNTTLRNSSLTSRKYAKTPPKPEELQSNSYLHRVRSNNPPLKRKPQAQSFHNQNRFT